MSCGYRGIPCRQALDSYMHMWLRQKTFVPVPWAEMLYCQDIRADLLAAVWGVVVKLVCTVLCLLNLLQLPVRPARGSLLPLACCLHTLRTHAAFSSHTLPC